MRVGETLLPHDAASLFPEMPEDEYRALKADIEAHGQLEPIVVHEGQILDGRHRYRVCRELGIEPKVEPWDGRCSPVTFVVSQNLHRRHLSASQKAAIAVQAAAMREAMEKAKTRQRKSGGDKVRAKTKAVEARLPQPVEKAVEERFPQPVNRKARNPQARDEVAEQFGTNHRYVQDAKTIRDADPQLLDKVARGQLTLPQAKQELRRQQKCCELESKAKLAEKASGDNPMWEIVQGDCVSVLNSRSDAARLIFADPPYNIGIDYGDGAHADRLDDNQYMAWVESWLAACRDRLTADGSLWVLIGDEYAAEYGVTLKRIGLHVRSWIKWFESFGVNCSRNFNRCSRHLFYCVRDPKNFVFHEQFVTRPSDRQVKYGDKRAAANGKLWDNVWGIEPPIPRLTGTSHERIPGFPTQLPLALLDPIVRCASDPGDLVIDPFNGSGTTGVAAIRNRRRYLGIEKSEEFADLARLRLRGVEVHGWD